MGMGHCVKLVLTLYGVSTTPHISFMIQLFCGSSASDMLHGSGGTDQLLAELAEHPPGTGRSEVQNVHCAKQLRI